MTDERVSYHRLNRGDYEVFDRVTGAYLGYVVDNGSGWRAVPAGALDRLEGHVYYETRRSAVAATWPGAS